MPRTGTLGSPQSALGQIQPGYHYTTTAVWKGPFPMRIAGPNFNPNVGQVQPIGTVFTGLPQSVASQLAAGDLQWWEFH